MKKGISLIVLVITIIVMIILATAIILSLNSSNISGKAGEAKLTSDLASKKEAASVYLAEYELKVVKDKIDKSKVTADNYVKTEMNKAGVDVTDVAITNEGNILVGISALFVNQEIPIGTVVKGYKLNDTTIYTTSGKENTYKSSTEETGPQPNELIREKNEDITWKYMGIDNNGNALIVRDVIESSPIMTLGGKGGYLYGPEEINNACHVMYSSPMGAARSIDIDDVVSVLEYTGDKGRYVDVNDNPVTTQKAKTINEIAKEIGYDMNKFGSKTPDEGKSVGTYKADQYYINKETDKNEYNSDNPNLSKLIYTLAYWLSSPSVYVNFRHGCAYFHVRVVSIANVDAFNMISSTTNFYSGKSRIRPVVELNQSVQMVYDESTNIVTLK